MKLLILIIAVTLTGCATPPKWLAAHYNNQDPCQRDPYISYCGASHSTYIYATPNNSANGPRVGYIRNK